MRYLTYTQAIERYRDIMADAQAQGLVLPMMAKLGREDLYYLMVYMLNRRDMYERAEIKPQWLYERVCEVQADPDGMLDLWAREHYKSTIITFGKTIQDILRSPEITVGIFSHTRPIAKDFLGQIKFEFEGNQLLKAVYPDVLWDNPRRDAPQWSIDGGIVVRRKSNPKEATVEAWGLVDGQPIGKHFDLRIYDDVVTPASVSTPDQIKKTTDMWAMSLNLGAHGGVSRYIGTRYHFNDTYRDIMERQAARPRIHAATSDGSMDGEPVFLQREVLADKRRTMGPYIFGCQMLQNPKADSTMGFEKDWVRWYEPNDDTDWSGHNIYILCDPAGAKKQGSDYTVMFVLALGTDQNIYLVDGIRDRLNLTERGKALMRLHQRWMPVVDVGYERYGMQADIEYMETYQQQQNYRFGITEVGGSMPKEDRIRRLVPWFEQGRIYLPSRMFRQDYEGKGYDLIQSFLNDEYLAFPVCTHDDMLDCFSRIFDLDFSFPVMQRGGYNGTTVQTDYDLYGDQGNTAQTEYDLYAR